MSQRRHPNRRDFIIGGSGLVAVSLSSWLTNRATSVPGQSNAQIRITINPYQPGRQIARDFIGLSYEASNLSNAALFRGDNYALLKLLRHLDKGVLRIGGNSVEETFWVDNKSDSATGKYPIRANDIDQLFAFARQAGWKVMLGLNLGKSTPQSAASEAQYVARVAGNTLLSFEIGNEPNFYHKNGLRSSTYQYSDFFKEFTTYFNAIRTQIPNARFSGPTTSDAIKDWVIPFVKDAGSKINMLSQHFYRMGPPQSNTVTIQSLLSPDKRLLDIAQTLRNLAQQKGLPYRISECNSVYYGGKDGVSNVFASALWAVDFMFTLAQNGAAGVNFHGGGKGIYTPIANSQGVYSVQPLYYGMLLFKLASPGRLLPVTISQTSVNLTAYAVLRKDRRIILTLLNKDETQDAKVEIDPRRLFNLASVQRLTAPSLDSMSGITLGGDSVKSDASWKPRIQERAKKSGRYFSILVPAGSAALVVMS